jgi:hypothetical protein
MRTTQCVRAGWLIGVLGACMLVAGAARADVTTDRPGSILIFPKVVADGTRDTVIQISNTDNVMAQARCFYINGEKGRNGIAQCGETDFLISLTKQQPTSWLASTGRYPTGTYGLDPGLVPPVPIGFTGALVCTEVDASLAPILQSSLKGEATLEGPGADLAKYNGIAFQSPANAVNSQDNDLNLDGVEYNACPATSRVNLVAAGAPDPIISGLGNAGVCINDSATPCTLDSNCTTGTCARFTCVGGASTGAICASASDCPGGSCSGAALASVTTNVTVLPCNMDMNAQVPTSVKLAFQGFEGDETSFSASTSVPISCWGSFNVAPPLFPPLPTEFATLEVSSGQGGPVLAVIQTIHSDSLGNTATAALNAHMEGQCVGHCTAGGGGACVSNADCTGSATCLGSVGMACINDVNCTPGACSGPRFCKGGTTPGKACTNNSGCAGSGTCPLPSAVIRLPGA